ncbi:hypothetical protein [Streptomyces sp. NBC_00151]|uniref:hypothetical protein n=1 Tax=Streptomyces sp. NBC_00151 TaxID=2975669 RepID=UPI002DD9ADB7|nr:hypothetical protein [Streptomyces sp. NBC_00151]WRZ40400.1 hypothetical protein OG915_21525 [Streptomyces sp. NBC_00151]
MNRVAATAMAPSTQTERRADLSTSVVVNGVQVPVARPADQLTAVQVCDLPMDELLARVNGSLDTTEIDGPKFLGYVTITGSGHITIYTPDSLGDDTRDAAIRYLITQHLGLPTHLFPDVFQVTRFEIAGSGGRA